MCCNFQLRRSGLTAWCTYTTYDPLSGSAVSLELTVANNLRLVRSAAVTAQRPTHSRRIADSLKWQSWDLLISMEASHREARRAHSPHYHKPQPTSCSLGTLSIVNVFPSVMFPHERHRLLVMDVSPHAEMESWMRDRRNSGCTAVTPFTTFNAPTFAAPREGQQRQR